MEKTFRIFLSSTFGDFQAEREALKERVWPKLESHCRSQGAAFEVVDLRWGVSESDALSHDTLRICLDEVAACQRLTPRPNFVMLIGDRYGWRPLPPEIPVEELKAISALLPAEDDGSFLQSWYVLDENSIPPQYRLLPRGDVYRSQDAWGPVEQRLTQLLRNAIRRLGMTPERRKRYFLSATHLEIVKGALAIPDADAHVFAFFRDIDSLDPSRGPAGRFTDLLDGRPDPECLSLREELRHEVREILPEHHCFAYRSQWIGNLVTPISTRHIDALCADVERALLAQVDRELQAYSGDLLDQEVDRHTAFGTERSKGFIGRQSELSQLESWAAGVLAPLPAPAEGGDFDNEDECAEDADEDGGDDATEPGAPPLIVHGPGGTGKSAFMARAMDAIATRHPGAVVITRFIGATPESSELASLLGGLLRELARRYGRPEEMPEGGLKELIKALPERLAWASPEKPLLLVIDALDQLPPSFEARHHRWLPEQMPASVAVVLSVLDGEVLQAVGRRYPDATQVALPAFTRDEGGDLLDALLLAGDVIAPERKRRLTAAQRQAVLDAFARDGRPLYLVLAASIVRNWTSWQAPEPMPDSIEDLVVDTIGHQHKRHGERISDRALDYLCASRYGVSDAEMRELLWRDPAAHAEFDERKNKDQPAVDALPPVIWSRIHSDLAHYLTAQNVGGSLLHRFFHRIIGDVVERVSLAKDAATVHGRIADYFGSQPLRLIADNGRRPNLRRLMEQPWQLTAAGRLTAAEALLTDFDFAMAKCEAGLGDDLLGDYLRLSDAIKNRDGQLSPVLAEWMNFLSKNAHVLRRGSDDWPSHKILLQLAIEEADDSTITQEAEAWLHQGHCDWVWVKDKRRPAKRAHGPLFVVLEGHKRAVTGATVLTNDRLLSWSDDGTLRLWDGQSGAALAILWDQEHLVIDATVLPDGRVLSWSDDGTLRLWDGQSGAALNVLEGHTGEVIGANVLADGRVLSWSDDMTLRLWDGQSGAALAVLHGHTNRIQGATTLPDGRVLSWSGDKTLRMWDGQSGAALAVLDGHTNWIQGATTLPDGRVLSWSADKTLRLWDGQSGAALSVLEGHAGEAEGAMALADGRVLSWSDDETLRLWDGTSGAALSVLEGHTGRINGANVLPGGWVLSWSDDGTLRLWDGQSGAAMAVLEGHADSVIGANVLADGRVLSWSDDGTLRLWDGQSGAAIAVLEGHTSSVIGVKVLLDGRVLSWSADRTLRLWDGQSGNVLTALEGQTSWVHGATVLDDGRVLSWSVDGTLRLWDGQSGSALAVLEGHTSSVIGVRVLLDGRVLSWSDDRTLRLWDGQSCSALAVLEGHTSSVIGVTVLDDGRVLSWSVDGTLRLWDGQSGSALAVLEGHTGRIKGATVLPDGRVLSWSADGTLRLWDGQSGAAIAVLEGHTSSVIGVRVLLDGRVLSWSDDRTLRLWDGQSCSALAVLEGHTSSVIGVTVLDDGRVLSWSVDGTLRLWDGQSGSALAVLEGHTGRIKGATVLPDGRVLSWSADGTLRLWDGHSGAALAELEGHTAFPAGAVAVPDGRVLSWSNDGTLRLWDGHNGAPLAVLEGHTSWVHGATILPDGRVLSWTYKGTLRLWDGQSGAALAVLDGHTRRIKGTTVLPDFRILSWSDDETLRLWDGQSGVQLEVVRQPWIENADFTAPLDELSEMAGAVRSEAIWLQAAKKYVALSDRRRKWFARWQGDGDVELACFAKANPIAIVGRQLIFLEVVYPGIGQAK